MQQGLREYIVTLKDYNDLDNFYNDMETQSYVSNIPHRAVQVAKRRPISRNTHYMLYETEADLIRRDSRVLAVELTPEELGIKIRPCWTQTSTLWNKSSSISASHRNWALLRCYEQIQRLGWGSTGTPNTSGTVSTTANGKNVDVVIFDGCIDPSHPEFAKNPDGTGGSRVNQFNWLSLTSQVTGGTNGVYQYTPYVDPSYPDNNLDGISDRTTDNNHGAHVAGTVAGNTYGWAREANIYNINIYGTAPTYLGLSVLNDYVRIWHKNKSINPATGLRNPTITNHSYTSYWDFEVDTVSKVRFRGVEYEGPFTSSQLNSYGMSTYVAYDATEHVIIPYYSAAWNADIDDAIKDGIVYVAAAGNDGIPLDSYSTSISRDYNNYVELYGGIFTVYYSRGLWDNSKVIVVGSVNDQAVERKSTFSNTGRRIDVYAPGESIISSVNSTDGFTVGDSRNNAYRLAKYGGTSMASPQVAGVLATIAEQWQTIRNETARELISSTSKIGQLSTSTGGIGDPWDLIFGENKYLTYNNLRRSQGVVGPKVNFGVRKSSGQLWPRTNIFRYGR